MNREQRRKISKKIRNKAEDIWFLETLVKMSTSEEVKGKAIVEMNNIISKCSADEVYLIDAYLTDKYGNPT